MMGIGTFANVQQDIVELQYFLSSNPLRSLKIFKRGNLAKRVEF
jgi:hypothetical protein